MNIGRQNNLGPCGWLVRRGFLQRDLFEHIDGLSLLHFRDHFTVQLGLPSHIHIARNHHRGSCHERLARPFGGGCLPFLWRAFLLRFLLGGLRFWSVCFGRPSRVRARGNCIRGCCPVGWLRRR